MMPTRAPSRDNSATQRPARLYRCLELDQRKTPVRYRGLPPLNLLAEWRSRSHRPSSPQNDQRPCLFVAMHWRLPTLARRSPNSHRKFAHKMFDSRRNLTKRHRHTLRCQVSAKDVFIVQNLLSYDILLQHFRVSVNHCSDYLLICKELLWNTKRGRARTTVVCGELFLR
jgi:hypothetical protein